MTDSFLLLRSRQLPERALGSGPTLPRPLLETGDKSRGLLEAEVAIAKAAAAVDVLLLWNQVILH